MLGDSTGAYSALYDMDNDIFVSTSMTRAGLDALFHTPPTGLNQPHWVLVVQEVFRRMELARRTEQTQEAQND